MHVKPTDTVVQRADQLAGKPGLENLRVVSGAPGRSPVTCTRLVDIADGCLEPGALLVCASGDVTSWRLDALIRRAAAAGAAGVVVPDVAPGPATASVKLAARLRLPLLAVPAAELLEAVSRIQTLVSAPEVERADRLLRCAYRWRDGDRPPDAVLADLERELGSRPALGDQHQAQQWAPELRTDLHFAQTFRNREGQVVVAHPIAGPSRQWLVMQLDDPPTGLADQAPALAQLATLYLRGWFLARRWELEQDRHQQTLLLAELIAEHGHLKPFTRRRAAEMGWRLDGWHIGLHFATPDEPTEGSRDLVVTALRDADVASAVVRRGPGWVGWLTTDNPPAPDALHRLLNRLRTCVHALGADRPLRIGVGSAREGPSGLVASLEEAGEVANGMDARVGGVASTDALGIHRLVGELLGSSTARVFAESALAPLAGETALLDTLATYLDSGNSVTTTASCLGVHRNTVNARLSRIHKTLSVDLSDPDVRLAFQLACRTLNVNG